MVSFDEFWCYEMQCFSFFAQTTQKAFQTCGLSSFSFRISQYFLPLPTLCLWVKHRTGATEIHFAWAKKWLNDGRCECKLETLAVSVVFLRSTAAQIKLRRKKGQDGADEASSQTTAWIIEAEHATADACCLMLQLEQKTKKRTHPEVLLATPYIKGLRPLPPTPGLSPILLGCRIRNLQDRRVTCY